jgi:hypothetical protein
MMKTRQRRGGAHFSGLDDDDGGGEEECKVSATMPVQNGMV